MTTKPTNMDSKFTEVNDQILRFAISTLHNGCTIYDRASQISLTNTLYNAITSVKVCVCGSAVAAVILSYMEELVPNQLHETVMEQVCQLYGFIENVTDDVKELERQIKWEATNIKYPEVVELIKMSLQYCALMKSNQDERISVFDRIKVVTHVMEDPRTIKRGYGECLRDICKGQKLTTALLALYDGITGNGEFNTDILNSFYEDVGGDKKKIEKMCCRLVQLFLAGLCAQMTYEMMMRGGYYAENIENSMFQKKKENIGLAIKNIIKKSNDELEKNMQKDVQAVFEKNLAEDNETIRDVIMTAIEDKYDCFYQVCIVYDDKGDLEEEPCTVVVQSDAFKIKVSENGKCVIMLFSRDDQLPVNVAEAIEHTEQVLADTVPSEETITDNENMRQHLQEKSIKFWAVACFNKGLNLKTTYNKAVDDWYIFRSERLDPFTRIVCLSRIQASS